MCLLFPVLVRYAYGINHEGKRRGKQKMRWLHSITDSIDMNLSKFWETVEDLGAGVLRTVHGVAKSWTKLSD